MKSDKAIAVPRLERPGARDLPIPAQEQQMDPGAKPKKALARSTNKRPVKDDFATAFAAARGQLDSDLDIGF